MVDFKRILVPTDFSKCSEKAVDAAVELARRYDASLTLLHVYEIPVYGYPGISMTAVDVLTPIQEAAQRELDAALDSLRKRTPASQGMLRVGVPWQEVLRAVDELPADLVVMGTHGRRGFQRAFLGSIAERVVRECPTPVMTVPGAPRR